MARCCQKYCCCRNWEEIQIQLAYAIGVAEPVSINVQTLGTGTLSDQEIVKLIRDCFELTPEGIIRELKLKQPILD